LGAYGATAREEILSSAGGSFGSLGDWPFREKHAVTPDVRGVPVEFRGPIPANPVARVLTRRDGMAFDGHAGSGAEKFFHIRAQVVNR
jgi:hypothetical protein